MKQSKWRTRSNEVIGQTIVEAMRDDPDMSENELRKRLRAAYPFGIRENHPYKIWCSAVNTWIGKRTKTGIALEDLPLFAEVKS